MNSFPQRVVKSVIFIFCLLPCFLSACPYVDVKREDIEKIIYEQSIAIGVDKDLVWSIALIESSFNPCAVSVAGAQGVMQLMPKTAEYYGVDDVLNPNENIRAGILLLKELFV